jgi:hypothetical protein
MRKKALEIKAAHKINLYSEKHSMEMKRRKSSEIK